MDSARANRVLTSPVVTIEKLAEATHRSTRAARQWVLRRRKAGRVVAVTLGGRVLVPIFQFDDDFNIDPDVADIAAHLARRGMSGWAAWQWFETPNTWLDDLTPAAALAAGSVERVRRAANGLFQD